MNTLLKDLRHAFRVLIAARAFTIAALLSLAIGIGANTAIFSIVDGLLLRPLPYADADRLVILWNSSPGLNITEDWFSTAQYFDIRNGHHGFEQVAIAIGDNYNLTGSGEPERIGTIRISSSLLALLGQRGMTLAFWGVVLGIIGALAAARLLRSRLFGVGANDLVTFVAVPALLAAVAFVASYIPARRASRIDPSISLHCE